MARNRRNKKILNFNPPAGMDSVKHRQIVSEVSSILTRLKPRDGYNSPWPAKEDKAALRAVLAYLKSEGINTNASNLRAPKGNKRR